MALWKISIKRSGTINGVRLEKGLSIELVTTSGTNPVGNSAYREQIARLFMNNYGIDLEKGHLVSASYLEGERVDR